MPMVPERIAEIVLRKTSSKLNPNQFIVPFFLLFSSMKLFTTNQHTSTGLQAQMEHSTNLERPQEKGQSLEN